MIKEPSRILMGSRVSLIDRQCIADGIDSKQLMLNAGKAVADKIICDIKEGMVQPGSKVLVLCGSGNNGGDGFVTAIELLAAGIDTEILCMAPAEKFTEDTGFYFDRLGQCKGAKITFLENKEKKDEKILSGKLEQGSIIVDAIFGTGLHGSEIKGQAAYVIAMVNRARQSAKLLNKDFQVYSADIPSGVDSDNASILGEAIIADRTITFGCKKTGIALYPGRDYAGNVTVADIGIPQSYYGAYEKYFEVDIEWVAAKIPRRNFGTYKHAAGKLLVIAGSAGLTGAATLACQAALRAGAGIVTLICPWELNSIMEIKLTEAMTYPVEQTDDITLHMDAFEDILEHSEKFDALAVGPGLSKNPSTICLVREILKKIKKPTVLDADGLRALYGPKGIGEDDGPDLSHVIMTPHAGELSAILGTERISQQERLKYNLEAVNKFGLVSVLKGAATIIADPSQNIYINPTGSWALATAGTGDILTGIIGSLLSQGLQLTDAAVCGTFIHGFASDIIASSTSRTAQIASDILEGLKQVFLEIEKIKY